MKRLKVMLKWLEPTTDGLTYQGEIPYSELPEKIEIPLGEDHGEIDEHDLLDHISDTYGWVIKFYEAHVIED